MKNHSSFLMRKSGASVIPTYHDRPLTKDESLGDKIQQSLPASDVNRFSLVIKNLHNHTGNIWPHPRSKKTN